MPTLAAVAATLPATAPAAPAKTVWLCRPGVKPDPCAPSLRTTTFTPSGQRIGTSNVTAVKRPKIDCFYVYPTVSDQKGDLANRHVDPEERSIALFQAARYSRDCRVFAPMYRQHTIAYLGRRQAGKATGPLVAPQSYADVVRAWHTYLAGNPDRGVVLIGHSQGAFVLRELIAKEIDRRPAVRRRLVSAILLGGDVLVKRGSDVGGDFRTIRACHSATQLQCVIAFSTYNATPPPDSLFGRSAVAGQQVLCTNPTSLRGGSGTATVIEPTAPFAPGTSIAAGISILGAPTPKASTPWISEPGAYRASCSSAGGARVLRISPLRGAVTFKPSPSAIWGLHLVDASIALGNLTDVVRAQGAAFTSPVVR